MNIGIGFGLLSKNNSFSNNEPLQNSIFLYFLLKNIPEYNVYIVNFGLSKNELPKNLKRFLTPIKVIDMKDIINKKINLNVFINPGLFISDKILEIFKIKNVKTVRIDINNNYMNDMNDIFVNPNTGIFKDIYDEIWIYENNLKENKTYLETIYNSKVEVVPFIWDDYFIKKNKTLNKDLKFDYVENEKKNITIFDSNNNLNDLSIYSLLLLEKVYNLNNELFKDKINKIRILNSLKFKHNLKYLSIVNRLNIMKEGFCSFEDNYDTFSLISKYTDVVISNQKENFLKYFYFEVLYGGYPLIHNCESLKSNGYYYNDNRIKDTSYKFMNILDEHLNNIEKYKIKFDKISNIYSINNTSNIKKYYDKIYNL